MTGNDDRPAYRPYLVTVTDIIALSEHFIRVTFTGPDLKHFGTDRLDQRIKVVFPHPDGTLTDFGFTDPAVLTAGDWHRRWRELPQETRNPIRTYTIRHVRNSVCEIDVDFFSHSSPGQETDGAASRWLARAAHGDALVIVGPDARSSREGGGIEWNPGTATRLLLAGDETAVPAIANIVETLDDHVTAEVFIEVGSQQDALVMGGAAAVTWLEQVTDQPGAALTSAIDRWARTVATRAEEQALPDVDVDTELLWEAPPSAARDHYIWLAGEAGVVKSLRRFLVQEHQIDKSCIAFMGYWRQGRAESL
ncbi:N/A [soil metagenome]